MLVRQHFPRVAPCTGAGMVTPMPVTRRLWAPITFVTIALAACKGTEPFVPVATTLHVAPSSLSFTSLGATRQVVAVVLDQRADTIKHPSVVWSSDNSGVATVSAFGLVTAVGNGSAHAVATTGGLSAQVTVSVAQAAAQLIKAGGDGQTGVVRATLPSALTLEVVDAGNRPMTGVTVTFAVTLGGGSLSNPSGPTNGSGLTTIQWTLGTTPGQQQLVQASLAGTSVSPATFSATATAGPPASATKLVGDSQTAATNNSVSTPPSVQVSDSYGDHVPGVAVTFAATAGGGTVSGGATQTDGNGVATVGRWTLGPGAGENTLTATVAGSGITGNPVTFTATAVQPSAPASVSAGPGDGQTGLTGYALNIAPAVVVRDAASLPVPNVAVTFAVASGGGSVTGANATTGADGVATVGSWTVQLGTNTLTATASGSGITGNPVTLAATGVSAAYHIDVRYLTAVTPAQREAFDSAAAQWERLIYGDVPDELANFPAGTCGPGSPAINDTIDDIIIYLRLDSIDGPGKILGQAGPCLVRDPGFQPVAGAMHFDAAESAGLGAAGQLDGAVRHEMGHVLGFGTIWQLLSLVPGAGGTDPHFVGAQATAAFDRNGGQPYSAGAKVPVENCCGPATRDGHWRETVFETELMTGFLDNGVPNPLSVITTASMGDLGYVVNYAGSDPYTVPIPAALRASSAAPSIVLGADIVRLPILCDDAILRMKLAVLLKW